MLSEKSDRIFHLFTEYGLSTEESLIASFLYKYKVSTPLEISRGTSMARTKVYRNIEKLLEKNLIEQIIGDRGSLFSLASTEQIESVIQKDRKEFQAKQDNLEEIKKALQENMSYSPHNSEVKFYKGVEGLKQITWNSLKAKGELLTYEQGLLESFIPQKSYAEDLRRRFVENKIYMRNIVNQTKFSRFTKNTEMVKNWWEARSISNNVLNITSDILIYNDVYALYRFDGEDMFCVEIHNQPLADMHRQMFEVMWNRARVMKKLDDYGSCCI